MAVTDAPIVTIGIQQIIKITFSNIKSVILFKNAITGESDIITNTLRLYYFIPLIATDSIITLWKQKKSIMVGIIAITDAAIINA